MKKKTTAKNKAETIEIGYNDLSNILFQAVRDSFRKDDKEILAMLEFLKKHIKAISGRDLGGLQRDAAEEVDNQEKVFYDFSGYQQENVDAVRRLGGFCRAACFDRGAAEWYSVADQSKVLEKASKEFSNLDFGDDFDRELDKKETLTQAELKMLFGDALDYAMGRFTYVSALCEDFSKKYAKGMNAENLAFFADEIKSVLPSRYSEENRKGIAGCDFDAFEAAEKALTEELASRKDGKAGE
jgi:hypothetical protein